MEGKEGEDSQSTDGRIEAPERMLDRGQRKKRSVLETGSVFTGRAVYECDKKKGFTRA